MMGRHVSLPVDPARLQAIVFDVDGTLYRQTPVRVTMLLKLIGAHVTRPREGLRTLRVISAYREAHESLRDEPPHADLAARQLALACASAGVSTEVASTTVHRWMDREALPVLARWVYKGVAEFLTDARERGLKLGILSDYPAEQKISALGLAGMFDVIMSAQDADVGVLKPHAKGLQAVLQRLGVAPDEALYVGDRPEMDGQAATNAGVGCAIIGGRVNGNGQSGWVPVRDFLELRNALFK